jgi:hypothetical protein
MYYLMDLERTIGSGRAFYWKANKHGYTTVIQDAGLFTEAAAQRICKDDFDQRTVMISQKVAEKILKEA